MIYESIVLFRCNIFAFNEEGCHATESTGQWDAPALATVWSSGERTPPTPQRTTKGTVTSSLHALRWLKWGVRCEQDVSNPELHEMWELYLWSLNRRIKSVLQQVHEKAQCERTNRCQHIQIGFNERSSNSPMFVSGMDMG